MPAGYSGTPLVKKLGIVGGSIVAVLNMPADYESLLGELPEAVCLGAELSKTTTWFMCSPQIDSGC